MPNRPYVIDQMISAKAIAARVEALAREITAHYQGCDKLVVVGLLRGSFVFIADLVREIDLPVEVDFLEASSYGDSMHSSREVRILKDLRGEIAGRDVLVVEDIVDTGFTLHHVVHLLRSREPARLEWFIKGTEQARLRVTIHPHHVIVANVAHAHAQTSLTAGGLIARSHRVVTHSVHAADGLR